MSGDSPFSAPLGPDRDNVGDASDPASASVDVNPYQATMGDPNGHPVYESGLANASIRELARWQLFFAIILGLMFLFSVAVVVFQMIGTMGIRGSITGSACVGVLGLIAYGLPAVLLVRASRAARRFTTSQAEFEYVEFCRTQKQFWRIIGILMAVIMGSYMVIILISVLGFAI